MYRTKGQSHYDLQKDLTQARPCDNKMRAPPFSRNKPNFAFSTAADHDSKIIPDERPHL